MHLDRIDHKMLSNSAILNMSFPKQNKKFVSDSSTNITDQTLNALKSHDILSPKLGTANKRYANGLKIREHNLKFVSTKDLPHLGVSQSDRFGSVNTPKNFT